ncbi:MAG: HD domain-containing phosphohydrolase [Gemmatimonadales bacterium]
MSRKKAEVAGPRVMIVDDDPKVRELHAKLLKAMGYTPETASDGIEALAKLPLGVDVVLLDGEMPNLDGFEVARRIREMPEHATLPIVMVTGLEGPGLHRRALEVGINDFVTKPVNGEELHLRLRWLVELKRAYDRLNERNVRLERSVEERTAALRQSLEQRAAAERHVYDAHLDTMRRLAVAAEFKDADTAGHIERVGRCAAVLAEAIGLSPGEVEAVRHATPMHDVGKLGIPDAILLKRGGLTEAEWAVMRGHTTLGARLLSGSASHVIQMGERIARAHHERWDGAGYPEGLHGEDIPLEARICSVVDCFDAVAMPRPYRPAFPLELAADEIRKDEGKRFDPQLRDAFFDCFPSILEARSEPAA